MKGLMHNATVARRTTVCSRVDVARIVTCTLSHEPYVDTPHFGDVAFAISRGARLLRWQMSKKMKRYACCRWVTRESRVANRLALGKLANVSGHFASALRARQALNKDAHAGGKRTQICSSVGNHDAAFGRGCRRRTVVLLSHLFGSNGGMR